MEPIVLTQNLVKIYGQGLTAVHALKGINLTIQPGEFVAVMGPSGCGKSTLLHLIGGLDRPTSGTVIVDGENLTQLSDDQVTALRRRKMGFIFQFFNLIPVLNALENAALPMILDGTRSDEAFKRAREWLERVGLGQRLNHKPSELSGGEQQRVAIARALASDPAIILADEPTGNLDSRASEDIAMLLRQISSEWGRTILLVTHDPRIAAYADRIVFLKDGQIVDETVMERRNGEQVDLVVGKMKEIGD
ncbi:ABC transporter ATP-binding protein [Thermanaerothrix sp. 4228-RoL]|jgi:putative ABC transport system ATP-binding protein|uniref:ABC transporter ATP-binding protein n=1 Tax=Thermanaerothrix solaris TaxID=3058434 RepID=A0ABU3NL35_9CHLR|nr:ABC transporter ATP-binding protein [Thermanaerothrix sp. 4228-RoL]MDT8897507.1 ABC transporter ATP-binding protein [Thermanaerothrix sp. 4228-RoL]